LQQSVRYPQQQRANRLRPSGRNSWTKPIRESNGVYRASRRSNPGIPTRTRTTRSSIRDAEKLRRNTAYVLRYRAGRTSRRLSDQPCTMYFLFICTPDLHSGIVTCPGTCPLFGIRVSRSRGQDRVC